VGVGVENSRTHSSCCIPAITPVRIRLRGLKVMGTPVSAILQLDAMDPLW